MKIVKEIGIMPTKSAIELESPVFIDAKSAPIKLYGFDTPYQRLPEEVAKETNKNVMALFKFSAGGVVRFKTDSDYIAIHADYGITDVPKSMSALACKSFDIYFYENGKFKFRGAFIPNEGYDKSYFESVLKFDGKMHDVVINCPMHSQLLNLSVGLREGSELLSPSPYKYEKPVVFYGSSIVHGACASRPGMVYPLVISRMLDTNIRNLGFGGGAKAEPAMIDHLCTLDMSVFVYDYDHNAPDPEYLEKTHYNGYKHFREAQPNTPIIMASRPDYYPDPEDSEKYRLIVEASYKKALAEGDKLVSFVDGRYIYDPDFREELTTDTVHPNDGGYVFMAKAIGEKVKIYLEK